MRRLNLYRLPVPVLVIAMALSSAWGGKAAGGTPPTRKPAGVAPETLDDPPAPRAARENVLSRSPSFNVVFGSYVSHQVNVDNLGNNIVGDAANEPSIAVNPTNPANMVIGWRQFDSIASNFRQAGYGYTFDGGANWTFPGVLEPGIFGSDPVLDADSSGNIYYQSLHNTLDLVVFKSNDGGSTWSAPVASFGGDKNWMVIDRTGGIGEGNIYGIWQRFGGACCGSNVLTRSANAGVSYETPVAMSLSPTFGTMAVGPDGTLYATGIDGSVGQDLSTFVVSRSLDAKNPAVTPTSSGVPVDLGGSMGLGGPNPAGLLGQANVAVDHSGGATHGNVYLLASVVPDIGSDPLDVHFSRSLDGGQTWSPFVRVNDDVSTDNWQWFGALSVAPNGRIDVVWNDTRNGAPAMNLSQLFYSYSYDAGSSWAPNVPVSPSFDSSLGWPQQSKLGDYYTMVSSAAGADVAYAATFNLEQDVYHVRVFPDCNGNGINDETDIADSTSADCDSSRVPDECQTGGGFGAGTVPDGDQVAGAPLTVRLLGANIELSWDESCSPSDVDYAIYEGTIGDFTSHNGLLCNTFGSRTEILPASPGNIYYLIAPTTLTHVGSLGRDSNGIERPQGIDPCLPQKVLDCCTVP